MIIKVSLGSSNGSQYREAIDSFVIILTINVKVVYMQVKTNTLFIKKQMELINLIADVSV